MVVLFMTPEMLKLAALQVAGFTKRGCNLKQGPGIYRARPVAGPGRDSSATVYWSQQFIQNHLAPKSHSTLV